MRIRSAVKVFRLYASPVLSSVPGWVARMATSTSVSRSGKWISWMV